MAISVENYLLKEFPSIKKYPSIIRKAIFFYFKKVFHEDEINEFLKKNSLKDSFGFIESVIDHFNIDIILNKKELSRVPPYGKVVIIANHPLGTLDALALIYLLQDVRKDIKVVANSFLYQVDNLKDLIIPVDNIKGKMDKKSLSLIYESLKKEEAVIIFPSGEVSRARPTGIKDTKYKSGFYKIAKKMRAPILPIYIKAKNSNNFYLLSILNKTLASTTIMHEMFKYHNKKISFKIGKAIPYESYKLDSLNTKEAVKIVRKHFYSIAKGKNGILKTQNEISLPERKDEIKYELKSAEELGQTKDGKKILLYETDSESVVLKEIGRLREISFRHVGEGSGKKRDIDSYDFYYNHLIVWDEENLEIAGAYRIGICKDIVSMFGKNGLYTSTLFNFDKKFDEYFKNSIELGRSFVQPKYWNSRALDYLWQGIGAYVRENKNIRYLFGPVSLSDSYSDEAKALIIYYYQNYFKPKEKMVHHKSPYIFSQKQIAKMQEIFTLKDKKLDFLKLKEELSLYGNIVPTLYKQYSEVCEEGGVEFHDFGVDKDFNNCIDGFIVCDLDKLKPQKRKRYIG